MESTQARAEAPGAVCTGPLLRTRPLFPTGSLSALALQPDLGLCGTELKGAAFLELFPNWGSEGCCFTLSPLPLTPCTRPWDEVIGWLMMLNCVS